MWVFFFFNFFIIYFAYQQSTTKHDKYKNFSLSLVKCRKSGTKLIARMKVHKRFRTDIPFMIDYMKPLGHLWLSFFSIIYLFYFFFGLCRGILRVFQGFVKRIHYWLIPELYELSSSLSLMLKEDLKISIISPDPHTHAHAHVLMKVLGQEITCWWRKFSFFM